MIKITETVDKTFDLSLKRFVKNSGIVIASPKAIVHLRKGFATINQLRYVPITKPKAVQKASFIPPRYASPGNPIKSQPDMSEASALKAVIQGPTLRPPIKKSLDELFFLAYITPIIIIKLK